MKWLQKLRDKHREGIEAQMSVEAAASDLQFSILEAAMGGLDKDPRDEMIQTLNEQLEMATTIATRQARIVKASRHLMDVLLLRDAKGPIFKLNEDDAENHEMMRHALLDLHAVLNGAEPPAFCLPAPERIN